MILLCGQAWIFTMYATDGVLKRPAHAGSHHFAPYGVGAGAGAGATFGQASPRPTKCVDELPSPRAPPWLTLCRIVRRRVLSCYRKPRIRAALAASKRNKVRARGQL